MGGQHLTPGAQPPSAPGQTTVPEEATLGEGGAAGTAAPESLSPLVHLRAPSSRRSGGGGPEGSEWLAGGRGAQPSSGPSAGSRGGSGPVGDEPVTGRPSARSAVPPAGSPPLPPSLRAEASGRLRTGRRALRSRRSSSSRPGPAAELLVPAALAPPGSPGRGAERPWPRALSSAGTEGLLPDPPAQLQEEPVDPQPPPHQRGGSHLVAGRIQRQQGEGEGTARTSGAQRAEGGEQRC